MFFGGGIGRRVDKVQAGLRPSIKSPHVRCKSLPEEVGEIMQYPKPVMKISELEKMGFTKDWLMYVFRIRNQTIAWKISPARNSVILFDTEALERFRKSQCGGGR